jgi:hypothetical protein
MNRKNIAFKSDNPKEAKKMQEATTLSTEKNEVATTRGTAKKDQNFSTNIIKNFKH